MTLWAFPRFAWSGASGLRFASVACGDGASRPLLPPNAIRGKRAAPALTFPVFGEKVFFPPNPLLSLLCSGRELKTLPLVAYRPALRRHLAAGSGFPAATVRDNITAQVVVYQLLHQCRAVDTHHRRMDGKPL